MKTKIVALGFAVFYFVYAGINANAKDEAQYKVFQHENFSFEYPNWKVDKKTDKGRLLLKVTKDLAAIQLEVFEGSLDTVYNYHKSPLEKSGAIISEDEAQHLLVHNAQALWIKLFLYRKFFESGEKTYVVTFASTRGNVKRYEEIREYVFNSVKIKEIEGAKKDANIFVLGTDKEYPCGIYLTDNEGSFLKRIYKSRSLIAGAKFSRDGKKIVFYEAVGLGLTPEAAAENPATLVHAEICTINTDGTGYKVLTHNDYADIQPNWSEDNKHIIFARDGEGRSSGFDFDIFIMDDQGENVKNITQSPGIIDADPHAYGGKIAFTRHAPNKINQSVWIMNEDGSGMYQLVAPPMSGKSKVGYYFGDFDPNISFDGKKVLVERLEDDGYKVFDKLVGRYSSCVVDIDGSELKNVSPTNVSDGFPHWLPDGRVVFVIVSDNLDAFRKLYVMNSDGTNRQPLIRTKPATFIHGRPSGTRTEDGQDLVVFDGRFYE